MHYLHCLNFDLSMSLPVMLLMLRRVLKKEVNVEISKKELYLGGVCSTKKKKSGGRKKWRMSHQ